jgi:ribosomal protein S26
VPVVFRKLEVLLFLLLLLLRSCASALCLKGSDKVESDNTAKVTVKTATATAAVAPTFFVHQIWARLRLCIFMALTKRVHFKVQSKVKRKIYIREISLYYCST